VFVNTLEIECPIVNQFYTLVGLLMVYSYCSHLEYRAPVKRFVSFQFLNVRHSVGPLGRVISPSQGRYLTQTQNKHRETSMPRVGFEPTIPASERAKKVHALDRATTVVSFTHYLTIIIILSIWSRFLFHQHFQFPVVLAPWGTVCCFPTCPLLSTEDCRTLHDFVLILYIHLTFSRINVWVLIM
jgi:hypothetical protein